MTKVWGGTTPLPNRLLDEVMPILSDTEWRLVCVIARQTLGWRVAGSAEGAATDARKRMDWMTHSQLKARTGRAGAAVSGALDGLVRRGLIQVCDGQGRVLATPKARRGAYTRLYFSLAPQWQVAFDRDVSGRESPSTIAESENQKPKTTKETGTKSKIAPEFPESEDGRSVFQAYAGPAAMGSPNSKPVTHPEGAEDVEGFVAEFHRQHQRRFAGVEVPPISQAEIELLRVRLRRLGGEEMVRRLGIFFESAFGYARRRNHSLASFLDTVLLLPFAARAWDGRAIPGRMGKASVDATTTSAVDDSGSRGH